MGYGSVFVKSFRECLKQGAGCDACVEEALLRALRERGFADFDRLEVEAFVEGVMVNEETLHVGGGREELGSLADQVILRIRRRVNGSSVEEPVIPGSSLKGVLRSRVESYAAGRGLFDPVIAVGSTELACTGEGLSRVEQWLRNGLCEDVDSVADQLERLFDRCLGSPVIGVFGSPWLGSHVNIHDAYPNEPPRISAVTRVAIDRFTASQVPGLLYTMEYVEPGYGWRFRASFHNLKPQGERWELVRYMFRVLEEGLLVGRRTSAGMGLVKLDPERTMVRLILVGPDGVKEERLGLREWLDGGWWKDLQAGGGGE